MLDYELDKKTEIFIKIGKKIALKRKKKRRKVHGISKKLNISAIFLDLIEQGEILKIPKHVPRLGFVKSYAKYLEVDISEELSEIYLSDSTDLNNQGKQTFIGEGLKKISSFLFLLILLLVILFLFN